MSDQPSLFGDDEPELTLADARYRRDVGMARVEAATDEAWRAYAWDWLCAYLRTHPTFFADDVWQLGLKPPHDRRAWGPVVLDAARHRLIRKTGQRRSRTRGHMATADVWESLIYRGRPR